MRFLQFQRRRLVLSLRIAVLFGLLASFASPYARGQSKPLDASLSNIPVFVSDFDLFSVPLRPKQGPPPATLPATSPAKPKPGPSVVYADDDVPSTQARRLIDFFAITLQQTLHQKGFQVARTPGQIPQAGAQIRGVFAESDAQNRIRRALLGGGSPSARFLLYVGIFNLARQDQPLYLPATVQSPSNQYGPVISVNSFIPLAKYELDKNPTEEDVQKICNQIAASLASLLATNANAFAN